MVKHVLSAAIVVVIASCAGPEPLEEDEGSVAFDTKSYHIDAFTKRVQEFLNDRTETNNLSDYVAIFVNVQGCSACIAGGFFDLKPYLSKTTTKTLVYVNDSTVISDLHNDKLQFVLLPTQTFKSKDIFHNDIYVYAVQGKNIQAMHLTTETKDSLNNLR
jgi:hypothetical protein